MERLEMENLASESNAKKINQRFKELEEDIRGLEERLRYHGNNIANLQTLIEKQNKVIADLYVSKYGNGPTQVE